MSVLFLDFFCPPFFAHLVRLLSDEAQSIGSVRDRAWSVELNIHTLTRSRAELSTSSHHLSPSRLHLLAKPFVLLDIAITIIEIIVSAANLIPRHHQLTQFAH